MDGLTLGIVGFGRIGAKMGAFGRALGMTLIAWSPNLTAETAEAGGARLVGKAELFREADVISLHMVLSDRSRHLVGAAELGMMKPGALLVNTSRGPLVDEAALVGGPGGRADHGGAGRPTDGAAARPTHRSARRRTAC